ncbi:hypothetical protein [Lapillicoccus sp.]|uniref:COG4315 family predicted lipoprotein n=1 Tax=Lapillicoccus sp. TaxID=1909287 RepID=UPI003267D153
MTKTRSFALFGTALATVALAACGSTPTTPTPAAPAAAAASTTARAPSSATAASATVKVATTSLGSVVVDGQSRTLYMFTKDTKDSGRSSCAGQCLVAWPPLTVDAPPTADGVTGTLATIATADGKKQVTLNGWPLYYYSKDTKAGDTTGQDVGKVWFVLDPTGTPVGMPAATTTRQTTSRPGY